MHDTMRETACENRHILSNCYIITSMSYLQPKHPDTSLNLELLFTSVRSSRPCIDHQLITTEVHMHSVWVHITFSTLRAHKIESLVSLIHRLKSNRTQNLETIAHAKTEQ